MNWLRDLAAPADHTIDDLFGRILAPMRWVAVIALLLLAYTYPLPGGNRWPIWALVALFVAYHLLVELLHKRWPRRATHQLIVLLDLPLAGLLYAHGAAPGGPLYVLILLVVTRAAASLNIHASLLYTAVAIIIVALIGPTLPTWRPAPDQYRHLGVLLIILTLVGLGAALLVQQLALERRERAATRAEAERLAEINRLRANFIASISHDLRTPLTAARAGLGMLEASVADRLRPNERQLCHTIRRSIARLGLLTDDLLALNQLEAGVLRLEREALDLRDVVADAVAVVQPLIREQGQTLEVALPQPLLVHADARRLGQVVVNLLSNANQHTPRSTRIRISGQAGDGDVLLSISDTGPGIPAAAQAAIFERFHQCGPVAGGCGLGLAIAQGIIDLHGGRIWVESAVGGGAAFHIALAALPGADAPAAAVAARAG